MVFSPESSLELITDSVAVVVVSVRTITEMNTIDSESRSFA